MSGVYLRFHWWRRPSFANGQGDLFHCVFGLGFCTVYLCRRCLLEAYRKLRTTIEDVVEREGR